jgi:xanthine dehydrogenase accessory factor
VVAQQRVLVRGSNDVASAVGHALFRAGYAVVLHDTAAPTCSRRKMAFTDAIFDGRAELEGVEAVRLDDLALLQQTLAAHAVIPIMIVEFAVLHTFAHPTVLVDARMRKRTRPEIQRHLAPLTIGLGPQFIAGETTHLAIETSWGDQLGDVVLNGATQPLAGEPRHLGGHGRERFVYAPRAGVFETTHDIGEYVHHGDVIATIEHMPIVAPLDGVVRGLTRSGVFVEVGTKILEVDPRGSAAVISGLGERPRHIAQGVLHAIQTWSVT